MTVTINGSGFRIAHNGNIAGIGFNYVAIAEL